VQDTATTAKDNVFAMFGGGPKREPKKEEEDVNEPSGSSKAQKKDAEVSCPHLFTGNSLTNWI
jgi:Ran-binding protein 1